MILHEGSRVVFVGDSVTDAGRDRTALPGGWGFGLGYVNHIHNLLTATYPDKSIMTINSGDSGDDIVRMADRWQQDVLDFQPHCISIMIGVNDVWRHFDGTLRQAPVHDVAMYERTYDDLLTQASRKDPALEHIVVISPLMFEPNHDEPMRAMLETFAAASRRIADRHHAIFVNAQADVDLLMTRQHSCIVSPDRVHPNERGAMVIARSWLKAVGFDWNRESFDD